MNELRDYRLRIREVGELNELREVSDVSAILVGLLASNPELRETLDGTTEL